MAGFVDANAAGSVVRLDVKEVRERRAHNRPVAAGRSPIRRTLGIRNAHSQGPEFVRAYIHNSAEYPSFAIHIEQGKPLGIVRTGVNAGRHRHEMVVAVIWTHEHRIAGDVARARG